MTQAPLVSVIIPTHNRASLIREAIDSVLSQTYPNFELIVVDNDSSDGTAEIVSSFIPPVRYIRQEDRGSSGGRNRGMREAKGELIAFLDSDDRWLPQKLEKQVELMEKFPETGMVGSGEHCIRLDGDRFWSQEAAAVVSLDAMILRCEAFGGASRALIRREVFDIVGNFDEDIHNNEDWDLWLRIVKHFDVRNVPEPLIEWRLHDLPRPRRDLNRNMRDSLVVINRHAPDRRSRRRARSWMHFDLANMALKDKSRLLCVWHLIRSSLLSPKRVTRDQNRLAVLLECALPSSVLKVLRWVKSLLSS